MPTTTATTSSASPHASFPGPSLREAVGLYAGYLAIFFATWSVNGVDYAHIGETVDSSRLHYAYPTLFGSAFLAVVLTAKGWWGPVLFDGRRGGPAWAWVGPLVMLALATSNFAGVRPEGLTGGLVLWSVLGGVGVGFGEEMITRGALLAGWRLRHTEAQAWLYSTLAFSALHVPNVLFGAPAAAMPIQLVFTFIMGSLLWATRRLSGTLLLPMFLHGFWDSSVFLPRATGAETNVVQLLVHPVAIVCVAAVLMRERSTSRA